MLGPAKCRLLDQPVAVSLDALVPADHFYRYLDAHLDLSFVREWVRDAYPRIGRPSIDPVIFFKLYLVMVFEGIRSERQLLMLAADRLSVRWYLGYSLDEPLPDASALTRVRQRVGLPLFRRFFEHVVDLCVEAGLVWGQELLADATRVPASAAMDSLVPRLRLVVDDQVVALFDGDEVPTERDADTPDDATRWDVLEECRLDPQRPVTGTYERISRRKISRTDPDATPMSMRDGRTVLGYQDHYLVDGGRARIILHAFVTPGDVSESQVLVDQLRRTLFRRKLHPQRVIADAKYGTARNIRALEEQGIRAYMPLREGDPSSPYYRHTAFTYDAEKDVYYCPQGTMLKFRHRDEPNERWLYRANASACNACSCKSECTPSSQGRLVGRSFHAEYLERVRSYADTPAFKKAMRKRSVWVEPLFAEAKQWHGLDRFRLRGLVNVNIEALLVATGQNLKRWLAATGWGRRWGPAGRLAAPADQPVDVGLPAPSLNDILSATARPANSPRSALPFARRCTVCETVSSPVKMAQGAPLLQTMRRLHHLRRNLVSSCRTPWTRLFRAGTLLGADIATTRTGQGGRIMRRLWSWLALIGLLAFLGGQASVPVMAQSATPIASISAHPLFTAAGVKAPVLASGQVDNLGKADRLRLERITVPAGASATPHVATGPELLAVQHGAVTIADNFGFSSTLEAGEGTLVQAGTTYQLSNTTSDVAQVLRFAVVAGKASSVAVASPAAATPVASPVAAPATVSVLLDQPFTGFPRGSVQLFLALGTWQPGARSGRVTHRGPLGLVVDSGTLTVTSPSGITGKLAPGRGAVLPASAPLVASNDGTKVAAAILVGVSPASGPLVTMSTPPPTPNQATLAPTTANTPSPTSTPMSQTGTVLYEASGNAFASWPKSDEWQTVSGLLVSAGHNSYYNYDQWIAAPYVPTTADYAVEAEVQIVRSQMEAPYFAVVARGTTGTPQGDIAGYSLNKKGAFIAAAIDETPLTTTGFDPGTEWHTYRIEVRGNTITFLIDGALVLQTTNNTNLAPGRVGLMTLNETQVSVRSFRVLALGPEGSQGSGSLALHATATGASTASTQPPGHSTVAATQGTTQAIQATTSGSASTLAQLLPSTGEVPNGMVVIDEGGRSAAAIAAGSSDPADAAQHLAAWGFQENLYRTFQAPDGSVPPDATYHIEVSLHQFATASGAAQALTYYADDRAQQLGLHDVQVPPMGDSSRAIAGPLPNGNETTVYVQKGAVVIRLTGWSQTGDPTADVIQLMQTMLASSSERSR